MVCCVSLKGLFTYRLLKDFGELLTGVFLCSLTEVNLKENEKGNISLVPECFAFSKFRHVSRIYLEVQFKVTPFNHYCKAQENK